MSLVRIVVVGLVSVLASGAALAASSELDPSFGQGGVVKIDLSPSGIEGRERGLASCPTADGRRLVVFAADRGGTTDLNVVRLNQDGSRDMSFGDGGAVRHAIATRLDTSSVCRADGKIWIASHWGTGTERRIRLIALGPDGRLVPGGVFGISGWSDVLPPPGSANAMMYGFNQAPDGRAFISGSSTDASGERPWLIALKPSGEMQGWIRIQPPSGHTLTRATTAGVGPGGGIWLIGRGGGARWSVFRAYLDPVTFAVSNLEEFNLPGLSVEPSGGAMVRNGLMLVPAVTFATFSEPRQPLLLVMRAGEPISALALPTPQPMMSGLHTGAGAYGLSVAPLPHGKAIVSMSAEAWQGSTFAGYKGMYFSRVIIGASAAEDLVDTAFGDAGHTVVSIASSHPSCVGKLSTQIPTRVDNWSGRPTIVGFHNAVCDPDGLSDAIVLRLRDADSLFMDGFE